MSGAAPPDRQQRQQPQQPRQEILIDWNPRETRVALLEDGALRELHIERATAATTRGRVGNVYLGRVTRVLPGLQSAFLDIGLERAAFLHVADLPDSAAEQAGRPIEQRVFEGQSLVVQVIRDATGDKGARLTMRPAVAGRWLVFLPLDAAQFGISHKIASRQRAALRGRLAALAGAGGGGGGFILRSNGADAGDAELGADIDYLRRVWARVLDAARRLPPSSLLLQDLTLLQRVLRDLCAASTQRIRSNAAPAFEQLQAFAHAYLPAAAPLLELDADDGATQQPPLFERHGIERAIEAALARRVELPSGGHLTIDAAEALTVVDVNSGSDVGTRGDFDATLRRVNLEAARAIAQQMRLRNVGGIVIADFIDMPRAADRDAVLAELRRELARDRVPTTVGAFSPLGLLELTRKRSHESLAQVLCETCPACAGRGSVPSARTVAYAILRELERAARGPEAPTRTLYVVATPAVIGFLEADKDAHFARLRAAVRQPIRLDSDATLAPGQYDVLSR